ncbi:MAG: aa3-type cytochrome c oxidase subunit IV [Rhodobacteraceae bacterium]|nr:aa3-type cytochrome c oxidase subunit IV [Paracoccaceae bacterium]
MAEFKHGTMDVSAQQKTFHGFIRVAMWIIGLCLAALVFMAVFNS